jgi:DnaK suppressor protein
MKKSKKVKKPVRVKPKSRTVSPLEVRSRLRTLSQSKIKTPFNKAELDLFKKRLLQIKAILLVNMNQMEKESLSKPMREASGDLSNLPMHLGDLGTDQYEQDFTISVMEGESNAITEINEALERIDDKTYGVCESCQKGIATPRLKAVPYARLCLKCKEVEEKAAKE